MTKDPASVLAQVDQLPRDRPFAEHPLWAGFYDDM